MRFGPRTLGGQLIALLLAALAVAQFVALVIYADERSNALRQADRFGLLESTASVFRVLLMAPPDSRPELARAASSPRVRIWISDESAVTNPAPASAVPGAIVRLFAERERVRFLFIGEDATTVRWPSPPDDRVTITTRLPFQDNLSDIVVSAPLPEGNWLNAQTQIGTEPIRWAWPSIASTVVMVIAILAITVFTTRRATKPLRALAARADALGRGAPEPPLPVEGPDEMRRVTAAFNQMQERLQRFVADRTRMIAAIGHDLRTPITSLKLRAELLDDEEAKAKMTATLNEMQQMVEATLAFARDEAAQEETRSVDLAALVASVVDDHADLGKDVRFAETTRLTYRCRPNTLRRAISNLIDNAVTYGKRARVSLTVANGGPAIAIEDRGPGIPEAQLDNVFQPFVRLEESRNLATGGVGLGLSIARSIVLAHGGELTLHNRSGGGLVAEIRLPAGDASGSARSGRGASTPAAS